MHDGQTDGRIDRRTDGWTDRKSDTQRWVPHLKKQGVQIFPVKDGGVGKIGSVLKKGEYHLFSY